MAVAKLGRKFLSALADDAAQMVVYDSELKGFGLRVTPSTSRNPTGTRSWFVEYRPAPGGRGIPKKRLVIGPANTISPEEARKAAREALALVRLGGDPAADRSATRQAMTIAELKPLFNADTNPVRKAATVELYEGYWNGYILPKLGNQSARAVVKSDLVRLHRSIGVNRRVTANRVLTLLTTFYGWARDMGYVPADHRPTDGIDKFREVGRERYLSADELARLGAALLQAETLGIPWKKSDAKHAPKRPEVTLTRIDQRSAAAIRLLLFTGARLREILNLKWSEVDVQRGLLLLEDSKSGAKPIVLGSPSIAILERLYDDACVDGAAAGRDPPAPLSKWVFHGEDIQRPRHDLKRPWRLVTGAAELAGLRIHDLRHSYASVGAGAGLGLPIIGKLLGHANPATTARYAHLDAGPLRRATDMISGSIAAGLKWGASAEGGSHE